jgi:hypothetical protein
MEQHKLAVVAGAEVGASKILLSSGYNIASLDAGDIDRNFRSNATVCDGEFSHITGYFQNPVACRTHPNGLQTRGCRGQEPCDVMFLKTGGEVMRFGVFPKMTDIRMQNEDEKMFKQGQAMCAPKQSLNVSHPRVDVKGVLLNLTASNVTFQQQFSTYNATSLGGYTGTIAVIIRSHHGYLGQLISLIFLFGAMSIKLPAGINLLVIVIPTEFDSIEAIRADLADIPMSLKRKNFRVTLKLFEAPYSLYAMYAAKLNELCTPAWRSIYLSKFSDEVVHRYCTINSPLHYTLCDVVLYYIQTHCSTCKYVLTTNADNSYSPEFFGKIFSKNSFGSFDVAMTNMVNKGRPMIVKALKMHIDLGSYLVSVPFLRRTGISFLNSLPQHADASDYHDADGHFIDRLVYYKARIAYVSETLYFHN